MATYHKNRFKFDRKNLKGVDADCIKGLNAYLLQREREINTFTTSVITYTDGPFAGQGVELCDQSPGMLPLDFNGWTGFYSAEGKWHGTTGKPLAIVECGALAARKDSECGKGFGALGDLFAELSEDPEERAFTVTTAKTVSIPQNGQDDFGNALAAPRRAGLWAAWQEGSGIPSRRLGGREPLVTIIRAHHHGTSSALFVDDFGDLANAPALHPDCSIVVSLTKRMAAYTIGRTTYKINATAERIDALRAAIISKKRYFSDKLIQRAKPEKADQAAEKSAQINTLAAQSVAQLLASATAAAVIEQASAEAPAQHQHQAPELATVAAESCEIAAVASYASGTSHAPTLAQGCTTTASAGEQIRTTAAHRTGSQAATLGAISTSAHSTTASAPSDATAGGMPAAADFSGGYAASELGQHQQNTPVPSAADKVPRALGLSPAAPTVAELVAMLQARGFHGTESRRHPGAVLLAKKGNDYPLTYANTTQGMRCIAKLAAAGVAAHLRGLVVTVTGTMQPTTGPAQIARAIVPKDGEHITDPAGRWEAWITGTEPRLAVLFYRDDAFQPAHHYTYKTMDKARDALQRFADEAEAIAKERDERKAARRAKLDQGHSLAVGDVLRSSWGYDQTNTDYFEVTRLIGKRTVEVRQIAEQIEHTGTMQGNSVPVPGKYTSEPMRRQVDTGGAVNILQATYGRAYKIEPIATVAGVRCFPPSGWSSYA